MIRPLGRDLAYSDDLTVVVPHLDAPEALARCLASLAEQRRGADADMSVIVVDNGSIRRPEVVCAAYPFVRLVEESAPGPGPARSLGARVADTPIIAFLDADCIARPGWAAAIRNHFRAHRPTAVIGGEVSIAMTDPARPSAIEAYESVYGYRMRLYVERDYYTATCNMAVRRASFLQVGDFAGISVAEDVDWGRRAAALGLRIDYVPEMAIETPARDDFAQLARKWNRHISHDFAEVSNRADRLRWTLRALALAVSPLAELPRIARSDRIDGLRTRALAFACLTRIRLYRCRRMLQLLTDPGTSAAEAWRGPR